jgi:hypothetical protein
MPAKERLERVEASLEIRKPLGGSCTAKGTSGMRIKHPALAGALVLYGLLDAFEYLNLFRCELLRPLG